MEATAALDFPGRAHQVRVRLLTPANAPVRRRTYRGLGAATLSRSGSDKVETWTLSPFVPVQPPRNAPPRFIRGKSVDVTDFTSWADLSALLLPHFEKAATIAPDSPLQAEIARIKAASPDPAKRTQLALELVQGKIRYVNLALGTGGLIPAGTDVTWQRRYGDCKAKTVLLIGLLRALDIAAQPVLVNSVSGDGLDERLPMVGLFDHVLVKAMIGGRPYWLDGTRTGDGRIDRIEVPSFHWGLPIARDATLERIMPGPLTAPAFETLIHTNASAGTDKPVPTTIEYVFRGDLALAQNQLMAGLDPSLRATAQREQLKSKLDRFEITKVDSSFDPDALVYRLRGEGQQQLDIAADDGTYWSAVPSLGYKADFRRADGRDRDAPVAVGFPVYNRVKQTIVLPKDRAPRITFQTPPTSVTAAGVEYRRTVTNSAGVITIDNHTRALVPEIPLTEAVAAEAKLRELDDDRIWIRLGLPKPSAQDVQKLLGREPKTASDFQQAATRFLKENEPLKAQAMLDRAIEIAPGDLSPLSLRGFVRMRNGDLSGALADADKYLHKNPRDPGMRELRATILWKTGHAAAAAAEAKALEGIDNAGAQLVRGRILALAGRFPDAIAAFRTALSYEADPLTHIRIAEILPAHDRTARHAAMEAANALKPADPAALFQLGRLALELGEADRALGLLDQAFLKAPDAIPIRHLRAVARARAGKTQAADREFDALAAKQLSANELNELCWAKAEANTALDRALRECDRALELNDAPAFRDSKAMTLLRLGRWDDAVREYDMALQQEEFASALFGRAIALARKGDRARSDSDAARALKLHPAVEQDYGHLGLKRQAP